MLNFVVADRHARPLLKREVSQLLGRPNILRIAYLDERGEPITHPVWYSYNRGRFLIATDRVGKKARLIRKNPIVYFLVDESSRENGTLGIRGKGIARVIDDSLYATRVTRLTVKRYLGKLHSKTAKTVLAMGPDSCVIEITPSYLATWKF
ncbi:MAG: pyridoxamine 5'-phosphate oxidase family protein [Thermoproteota archaeon]|nr:pyridoxamine 5'-phosphate oxidase family protein [Thermoproteota archaeon]MDQ3882996.1 pyridoxamine 5'-phosphate oxidase family protein [Thermoproteota archaeon]MDQ5842097.1 pyridoxamine 5'-phosphate oxidase family protein [Thermoproteota archaeon]